MNLRRNFSMGPGPAWAAAALRLAASCIILGVTSSIMPAALARWMPLSAARFAASVPSHATRWNVGLLASLSTMPLW
eukprot:CAMPEP_0173391126 /NCGR_PEP_ID=MMETSP1356-20130122/17402_1 /TAXON_ID=77927 ORGANISM="Hemiselmis virescens, Strain PCC157" /NCGR_SAMPLE_ID=MMETSP1356 /ASSEMBLY_ACC=CAM_ASM_000847 /LENGTH=76 /DNA_ID=CAMNT_0014348675 /DNA_START=69 /DNA_END=296 /DNA_ORIENTATION=-